MPRTKSNGHKWKPIEIVPRETKVTLKTVRGLVREGHVPKKNKLMKPDRHYRDGKRVRAKCTYPGKKWVVGAISAVAWR